MFYFLFLLLSFFPLSSQADSSLAGALQQAADLQLNFEYDKAIDLLKESLERFENSDPGLSDLQKLADVHLYLAYLYKNGGNQTAMKKELEEAARFNPSLVPNEMIFPPSLGVLLEEAKDRIWQEANFGEMMIDSQPSGADLFINGAYKGKTPLRLDRYPAGSHHLVVRKDRQSAYKKINLKTGTNERIVLKLKRERRVRD